MCEYPRISPFSFNETCAENGHKLVLSALAQALRPILLQLAEDMLLLT